MTSYRKLARDQVSYNPSIGQGEIFEILSEELLEIDEYLESISQFKEGGSSERYRVYSSMNKSCRKH